MKIDLSLPRGHGGTGKICYQPCDIRASPRSGTFCIMTYVNIRVASTIHVLRAHIAIVPRCAALLPHRENLTFKAEFILSFLHNFVFLMRYIKQISTALYSDGGGSYHSLGVVHTGLPISVEGSVSTTPRVW